MGGKILLVMAKLFIRIGPRTCIPVTRSMKEPVIGISISQRLSNEFNVGERRLKISDDRPDAILFIFARDEVRGHPAPHSGVIVQLTRTGTVSYTHLRAHETDSYLVCRLL